MTANPNDKRSLNDAEGRRAVGREQLAVGGWQSTTYYQLIAITNLKEE